MYISIPDEIILDIYSHNDILFSIKLFSTNMLGRQNPTLRLRELIQRVEPDGKKGNLTNVVSLHKRFALAASAPFYINEVHDIEL